MRNRLVVFLGVFAFSLFLAVPVKAQVWQPVGPPGGDVRSLAADPNNSRVLYLGTSDGHIFTSRDGGEHWRLLSRVGKRTDTVVMTLLVHARDARVLFAGTWTLGNVGGGVYRSDDGGATWQPSGLQGPNVRMLAQAASDPDVLVAATIEGVFRSLDEGKHWQQISPAGHPDLRNFDSIAIDPHDTAILYAGTYHLSWKTLDGGRHWIPMHRGMIDDSDVMSLTINRQNPDHIFATACSGMYRSENRGDLWTKIQGIPYSSRRTYFLQQDPRSTHILYAGTTEGLWKSVDDGKTWQRTTPAAWPVIGLVIDRERPDRLVLGVERHGIEISEDGGKTFRAANEGFNHQQAVSFTVDPAAPARMLVVLTNNTFPIRESTDGGRTWKPIGRGLPVGKLRRVFGAPNGWWASMQDGGLMRYEEKRAAWVRAGLVEMNVASVKPPGKAASNKTRKASKRAPVEKTRKMYEVVLDLAFSRNLWLAATPRGALVSRDQGRTWADFAITATDHSPVQSAYLSDDSQQVWLLGPQALWLSSDGGTTWTRHPAPFEGYGDLRLHRAGDGTLAVTSNKGLYLSDNNGLAWHPADLWDAVVLDFVAVGDVYLASGASQGLFTSRDHGKRWDRVDLSGAEARFPALVRLGHTHTVLAASSTEGLHALEMGAGAQQVAAAGQQ